MSQTSGNSSTPIIAIVGAIALSVVLFFAFTLPKASKEDPAGGATGASGISTVGGQADGQDLPSATPPEPEPEPEPEPVAKLEEFASARALVATVAQRLAARDFDGVAALVGETVLADPRALGFIHAFSDGGYIPLQGETIAEIGDMDEMNRWALFALPAGSPAGAVAARRRIMIDVTKAPQVGWKVAGIHVPGELRQLAVAAGVTIADSRTEFPLDRADPLFVADDFVNSLLSQNFEQALSLCGEAVLDEKIAGLCMVFEEGEFHMLQEKPLTTTSLGADKAAAWVFARVRSDKLGTDGEFAVELKVNEEKGWEVDNVNIESMLQDFVKGPRQGGCPTRLLKRTLMAAKPRSSISNTTKRSCCRARSVRSISSRAS